MSSHGSTSYRTNKILKYLLYIIIIAAVYEFIPSIKNSNILLPEKISLEKTVDSSKFMTGYKVVKVIDGDTIDVQQNNEIGRVRLLGINTPESVDPRRPVECFGKEASKYMKSIASDQEVYLETDSAQSKYDKYGRLLAYVYLLDGQMLNRKMIADGYAYEYTYDKSYKYQKDFKEFQNFAKNEARGLWASDTCDGRK